MPFEQLIYMQTDHLQSGNARSNKNADMAMRISNEIYDREHICSQQLQWQ